ncbi:11170_t:CDS:2 [Dentiscutata erythropus]|uniref:11170_t:CDS:1 n=1 Tax=Dentiscutata erythropus TaxID=1348616 RepID=A0A9N9NE27_9GLOM|nr:11170_t:CDS:2 [Dentiscutata erythropus]
MGLYDEATKGRSSLIEALSEMDNNMLDLFLSAKDHMKISVEDAKQALRIVTLRESCKLGDHMTLYNTNTQHKERVNKLLQMHANDVEETPSITAGNIGVIIGLKVARTGDTLIQFNDSRKSLRLQAIDIPAPVFFRVVEAAGISGKKSLEEALKNILRLDPSLHVHIDQDSGQTLISGMGELHLEIVKDRLLNDFKVKAELRKMRISYREAVVTDKIDYTYLYEREVMGKRVKVQVSLTITPLYKNDQGSFKEGGNRITVL